MTKEYEPTFEEAVVYELTGQFPERAVKYLSKLLADKVEEDIARMVK